MAISVIVNGALGKMGALACETLKAHPDFNLVAELTKGDDLRDSIENTQAQIVVDLTRADVVYQNALTIIAQGACPIIGTSGLTTLQLDQLKQLCGKKELGGIVVPNFSIGAVLMMRFAEQAAKYLPDVEIIEAHHPQKFDAPSGTGIKTAELIAKSRMSKPEEASHELIAGARGGKHQGVTIHSLRLHGVLARQDVIFGNKGETLSIVHNSIDRQSFMPGLVLCCEKVCSLKTLYYGLDELL